MRIPRKGDEWQLSWMKHKPVKRIDFFGKVWLRSRGTAVPAVWFEHLPKGKTIMCSVRFLLENGVLVKPSNNASSRPKVRTAVISSESVGGSR